jgi:hypothetical protein
MIRRLLSPSLFQRWAFALLAMVRQRAIDWCLANLDVGSRLYPDPLLQR